MSATRAILNRNGKFHPEMDQGDADRFWSKAVPVPESGCWLWEEGCYSTGYGQFNLAKVSVQAHRVAFFLANGPFLAERSICHKCDVKPCVNPDHLYCGTQSQNALDWVNRSGGNRSSLSESALMEIARSPESGVLLARRFGVDPTTISKIRRGKVASRITGITEKPAAWHR